MQKDLTTSEIHRRNILNNRYALRNIADYVVLDGVLYEGIYRFTGKQIAHYFDVSERTIERYLESHHKEIEESGYEILKGKRLKEFKKLYEQQYHDLYDVGDTDDPKIDEDLTDTDVGNIPFIYEDISKAPKLGVFSFKAFLNISMLLTESKVAKELRSLILNIVIDTLNKRAGIDRKFINQREEEYLPSFLRESHYRKGFTDALDRYVEDNNYKYALLTNEVYKSIFKENAEEYRKILRLEKNDATRDTMYSEVLDLIASYENGFSDFLKNGYEERGRKFTIQEAIIYFRYYEQSTSAIYRPLIEKARSKMASRDIAFRDALHEKLKKYITHLSEEEYKKFIGETSKSLEERIEENKEVFKRLKDK